MSTAIRNSLIAGLIIPLISACAISVTEKDIFLPEEAAGTTISISDGDRVLFELNEANPDIWEEHKVRFTSDVFTYDQTDISYKIARNDRQAGPLFIYCGGNTFDVPNHGDLAIWKVVPYGDVLVWDYPGFGKSEVEPTVAEFRKASASLVANLDSFTRDETQEIVFWGQSLGGFVCSQLAAQFHDAASLIIEISAPSAQEASRYLLPWYARPFVKVELAPEISELNSVEVLDGRNLDILVLGARKDKILPVQLSRSLQASLGQSGHDVTYHEFRRANHFNIGFEDELSEVVESFLETVTP